MPEELSKVSVITPCYNAGPFVRETIESVFAQSYSSVEMIVVDDGSADDSLAVLESFGDRIRTVRLDHQGGGHARNHGARQASGRFLM